MGNFAVHGLQAVPHHYRRLGMNAHKLSIFLTASFGLLMFATAQAGELSMDAGRMVASNSSAGASDADCPKPAITRAIQPEVRTVQPANSAPALVSDARQSPAAKPAVAAADAVPPTGSSASGVGTLITPSKLRGNRWQSLVPGAIK